MGRGVSQSQTVRTYVKSEPLEKLWHGLGASCRWNPDERLSLAMKLTGMHSPGLAQKLSHAGQLQPTATGIVSQ